MSNGRLTSITSEERHRRARRYAGLGNAGRGRGLRRATSAGCGGASALRRAWLRRGRARGAGAGLSAVRRRRALLVRPALLARLLGPPVRGMVRPALVAPLLS